MDAARASPEAIHPVILIHGGGPRRLPQSTVAMDSLADLLVARGYPRKDIFLPAYPQGGDRAASVGAVSSALVSIQKLYPEGTTFEVIAHSLGHAVALMAIVENGLTSMVRNFVGIAGAAHGQDRRMRGCLLLGGCGDLISMLLPAYGGWIGAYHQRYAEAIATLNKCSLFSPEDGTLDPYDSGAFSDGTNIELRGVRHLDFKRSAYVADAIIRSCLK